MPQNVEIKALAGDFAGQQRIAAELTDVPVQTLEQLDTFFNVPQGRLKLREFAKGPAQLIFYHRHDQRGPKLSDYQISESDDAPGLKQLLGKAYGIRAVVSKSRQLYMCGRTRMHFDTVAGLGQFIELEVVLDASEEIATGEHEASQLMQKLGIRSDQLIEQAYVDLIESAGKT